MNLSTIPPPSCPKIIGHHSPSGSEGKKIIFFLSQVTIAENFLVSVSQVDHCLKKKK